MEQALAVVDEHGTVGPRLVDDAVRLWRRIGRFIAMNLRLPRECDVEGWTGVLTPFNSPCAARALLATFWSARASHPARAGGEAAELLLTSRPIPRKCADRPPASCRRCPTAPRCSMKPGSCRRLNLDDFGSDRIVQYIGPINPPRRGASCN